MNSIISYGVNAMSELSDRADENNDNKNFQQKIKLRKSLPVMKSEERQQSQKLLRDAMQNMSVKPALQSENRKSLASKLADGSLRRQSDSMSQNTAALKKAEDFISDSTQTEPEKSMTSDEQNLPEKMGPQKLLTVLDHIEDSLGSRRPYEGQSDKFQVLKEISSQLSNPEKLLQFSKELGAPDRNKIKASLEFLEGYFEKDSEHGNAQNDIFDSLHQIIAKIDNLPANNGIQQAPNCASEFRRFEGDAVFEKDKIQSLRKRKDDQNLADGGIAESVPTKIGNNRVVMAPKELNGVEKTVSSNAKGVAQRTAKKVDDEKRNDTLPLVTIRSV